jgi:hypothetical protein
MSPGTSKPATSGHFQTSQSTFITSKPTLSFHFQISPSQALAWVDLKMKTQLTKTKWPDQKCPLVAGSWCPLTSESSSDMKSFRQLFDQGRSSTLRGLRFN